MKVRCKKERDSVSEGESEITSRDDQTRFARSRRRAEGAIRTAPRGLKPKWLQETTRS